MTYQNNTMEHGTPSTYTGSGKSITTKIVLLCIIFGLFATSLAAADLRYAVIDNIYPDATAEDSDVHIIISLETDTQGSDNTVTVNLTHPNGTLINQKRRTRSSSAADQQNKYSFHYDESTFNTFGAYNFSMRANTSDGSHETDRSIYTHKRHPINIMSSQLSVTLALLFLSALFAYIGFKLDPASRIIAVLRAFLVMLSPIFGVVAAMTAGIFARDTGYPAIGITMDAVFLGSFFAWFVIVTVIGLLLYMTDAFKEASTNRQQGVQDDM